MVSLHPTLPLGDFGKLQSLAPDLAEAAREVHAGWEQVDGLDPDLGVGGICQDVAAAMCGVLDQHGFEAMTFHTTVGENHVFVVALAADGVYTVDIPPSVYESGSGFVWRKKEGAVFDASAVVIERIGDPLPKEEFMETYGD